MDLGVHCISQGGAGPVGRCLELAGLPNDLEFTSVRPLLTFGKEAPFKFPGGLKEHLSPEDFGILMRIMADFKAMSEADMTALDELPLKEYLLRYTDNPIIHACFFKISCVYCVLPLELMSTGEFARCLVREAAAHASGYPSGGCIGIINKYLEGLRQYGGTLLLNTPVERILVENDRAVGVLAGGKEYRADMIVSNGDIRRTVLQLVGEAHFTPEYLEYVKGLEYSWGPYILRFALDQPITDLKMLSVAAADPAKFYADIRAGRVPEEFPLFIVVPSNFCKGTAPEGKQYICCGATYELGTTDEWFRMVTPKIIDSMERYLPGLKEHTMWVQTTTINALDRYAYEKGCTIGVAQTYRQAGRNRPSIQSPLKGLYYVGAEAGGSGVGVELCINSAIEFFEKYA